jgi:acetyl-CoA C-acetyltransferase
MTARIIAACRSAVVPRGGAFAHLSLEDLGAPVLCATLANAGVDPGQVNEVIISNALGGGGNPARLISLSAGLPDHIAGLSIDRQCAGGLDALLLAKAMIESGAADIVIAGGVESYSRRPLRLRTFADGSPPVAYDQPPFTPWPDRDPDMAVAANMLARHYDISRETQDQWAIQSHAKARAHTSSARELVAIEAQQNDPFTRNLTLALAARAKPLVGSITPANMAVAADAAAFCLVVSDRIKLPPHITPITITGGATKGAQPEHPGIAPLAAIEVALAKTGLCANDITCAEIMEAFAVQAIACIEGANLDPARVNIGGGALARGHPIGASGTINAVRLFHELQKTGGTGLAAIAAAGGIATALILSAA